MGAKNPGRVGRPWRRLRATILNESDVCWLCGLPGATTVDHIIPLSKGGHPTDRGNLAPAHKWCNGSKGNREARPRRAFGHRPW